MNRSSLMTLSRILSSKCLARFCGLVLSWLMTHSQYLDLYLGLSENLTHTIKLWFYHSKWFALNIRLSHFHRLSNNLVLSPQIVHFNNLAPSPQMVHLPNMVLSCVMAYLPNTVLSCVVVRYQYLVPSP